MQIFKVECREELRQLADDVDGQVNNVRRQRRDSSESETTAGKEGDYETESHVQCDEQMDTLARFGELTTYPITGLQPAGDEAIAVEKRSHRNETADAWGDLMSPTNFSAMDVEMECRIDTIDATERVSSNVSVAENDERDAHPSVRVSYTDVVRRQAC